MWHYQSRAHSTRNPIGSQFEPTVYLARWVKTFIYIVLSTFIHQVTVAKNKKKGRKDETTGMPKLIYRLSTDCHDVQRCRQKCILENFWVITLIFWGHVTSPVAWPLDSQYIWFPIGGHLEPTIYLARFPRHGTSEILGSDFDFLGSLTSSVTWPLDLQYDFL